VQRIEVTEVGITVTSVSEPVISVFGKEMRPGHTSVSELPWDEIFRVYIEVIELPTDGERWITLVVDLTWGEFLEVHDSAEGYAEAVRELCRLSGEPVPEPAVAATIWPGSDD